MSFFGGLMKVIQGKPVYDTTPQPVDPLADQQGQQPTQPASTVEKFNVATFPVVFIAHTHAHLQGNHLEIRVQIHNEYHEEIRLNKLLIFGQSRSPSDAIPAHSSREILIYSGPAFDRQLATEALLDFRTLSGDYFQAVHQVQYFFTPEKVYSVTNIQFQPPIRDIFG
jgi:hypothetical protein